MKKMRKSMFMSALPFSVSLTVVLILATGAAVKGQENVSFTLSSTAFSEGQRIPDRYTCTGENVSPPLAWTGAPEGTVEFALIMHDPDAPGKTWVHWVAYRIDPTTTDLAEGISLDSIGVVSGTTSFRSPGYGGPCPPAGAGNHRYIFTLYALSASPNAMEGATRTEVLSAIKGITIDTATLMGLYSRR